jgi:hypothetical protein
MAESYGTSIHIDLLWVKVQLSHAVHTHGSESLIDLHITYEPSFLIHVY